MSGNFLSCLKGDKDTFETLEGQWVPGVSLRNPANGKGHEEGSPTKRKGVIHLRGFPLSFPEPLPPKTRVCLLHYCAFDSSDILLKKKNYFCISSASAQTPLMTL